MKRLFAALILSLFLVSASYGAESLTESIQASGPYKIYNLVWVTGAAGGFTATTLDQNIDGIVMLVEFIPSASAAPTTLYDVTLRAETSGIDVLGDTGAAAGEVYDGAGANLSATVASKSQPLLNGNYGAIPAIGSLTLDILNAGNDKGGTVRIHYLSITD